MLNKNEYNGVLYSSNVWQESGCFTGSQEG